MDITHYIPPFTSRNAVGAERAACGAWTKSHSAEPICARCAAWLTRTAPARAEEEREAEAIAARILAEDNRERGL
jgi:hypothetical protein